MTQPDKNNDQTQNQPDSVSPEPVRDDLYAPLSASQVSDDLDPHSGYSAAQTGNQEGETSSWDSGDQGGKSQQKITDEKPRSHLDGYYPSEGQEYPSAPSDSPVTAQNQPDDLNPYQGHTTPQTGVEDKRNVSGSHTFTHASPSAAAGQPQQNPWYPPAGDHSGDYPPQRSSQAQPGRYHHSPAYHSHGSSQKSLLMAVLLALLGGGFGIHNLYLGHIVRGMCQFSLTILGVIFAVFFVGLFFLGAVALWVIIEVMFMVTDENYTDARGVPLKRI